MATPTRPEPTEQLTQLEFTPRDFTLAEEFARRLGYSQHPYTTTSALWGLFCLPENPATAKPGEATKGGAIIKTRELGFLFVQSLEDHRFADLMTRERRNDAAEARARLHGGRRAGKTAGR